MERKEFVDRFIKVRECFGCQEILEYEHCNKAFCPTCYLKWNTAKTENCPKCFKAISECACMPQTLASSGALCLRKLIFYVSEKRSESQNKMIYHLKRYPNKRLISFVAHELLPKAMEEIEVLGIKDVKKDVVFVSAPRSLRSKNTYGFDQSELVCEEMSRISDIAFLPIIKRRLFTKEQKKFDKKERIKNMKRSFLLRNGADVRDKCVILFDDIVTTGASLAACTDMLKKAGAKFIICLCIAYSKEKRIM